MRRHIVVCISTGTDPTNLLWLGRFRTLNLKPKRRHIVVSISTGTDPTNLLWLVG